MLPARLIPPSFDPGTVWLVGAGPGDPGLLTLHALHALTQADVILHDALVAPEILDLAPQARLEQVGKRAGGQRTPQLRISQRLVTLARQGLRVVRLKGGDPFVFGRGAEEALALAAAAISFRIVPGISAGIGGTASAGIPLTHRLLGRSAAFATGHDSTGHLADIDWAAFSRGADVLVLYMASRQLPAIASALIEAGRASDDEIALIANATTHRQTIRTLTLHQAANTPDPNRVGDPVLIVIGPVVALRRLIADWQQIAPMTIQPMTIEPKTLATAHPALAHPLASAQTVSVAG